MADSTLPKLGKIKPLYLVAGGIAVVGGIFLARRFQGGAKSSDTGAETAAAPVTIEHPLQPIQDAQDMADLRRRIGEIELGKDQHYPPITQPAQPAKPPAPTQPPGSKPGSGAPAPSIPVPIGPAKITKFVSAPATATREGQTITFVWETTGIATAWIIEQPGSKGTKVAPTGTLAVSPPRAGNYSWTLQGFDAAGKQVASQTITRSVTTAPRTDRPEPVTPPATNPNVPGGYPESCSGVLGRPTDHPGQDVVAWIKASNNPSQRAGKALGWAVAGIGSSPIPTKLGPMRDYLKNSGNWPTINRVRRTRGLKPLNNSAFAALRDYVAANYKGRDAFPDNFIQALWNTYHLPYLC